MTPNTPENPGATQNVSKRIGDTEEGPRRHEEVRQNTLDKTIADSFPTSDPPSSIPDPVAAHTSEEPQAGFDALIASLPSGSWAAISEQERRVVGTGATREEALQSAAGYQATDLKVIRVPQDPEAPEQAA